MKIATSATRMELMKLKRRLALAVRGHHLLKDKQDELVRQFFLRQEEYRGHLGELWRALARARESYALLRCSLSAAQVEMAAHSSVPAPSLQIGSARVLNLAVPTFGLPAMRPAPVWGLLDGAGPLENVVGDRLALLPLLVSKAELEKAMAATLAEIEVTKRRVNALEYKLIPSLRDSIATISSKLNEMELSTLTRLMRVKEIILQEEVSGSHGDAGSHGRPS